MKKDPVIFIKHILEAINLIEMFTQEISKETFLEDIKTQDAVVRRIEIIGEAVKNLPNEILIKYPQVPWSKIVRTRDKLIHHYFGVDLEKTWLVITENIPELKQQIKEVLDNETN